MSASRNVLEAAAACIFKINSEDGGGSMLREPEISYMRTFTCRLGKNSVNHTELLLPCGLQCVFVV